MVEDKDFFIFENILSEKDQEIVKDTLFGYDFPWTFIPDVTFKNPNTEPRPAFSHVFYEQNGAIKSNFCNIVHKITEEGLIKLKKNKASIIQARSFLQMPLNKSFDTYDAPHLDLDYNHIVFLYYVCDSDGDTILFNENNISNIKHKITPKKGRLLIFEGKTWHTAEQPKENIRCIINIDLIV